MRWSPPPGAVYTAQSAEIEPKPRQGVKPLQSTNPHVIVVCAFWTSAWTEWHARGRRFDPGQLHFRKRRRVRQLRTPAEGRRCGQNALTRGVHRAARSGAPHHVRPPPPNTTLDTIRSGRLAARSQGARVSPARRVRPGDRDAHGCTDEEAPRLLARLPHRPRDEHRPGR